MNLKHSSALSKVKKNSKKALLITLLLLTSAFFVALAYIYSTYPELLASEPSLPEYVCFADIDGNTVLVSEDGHMKLTLEEYGTVDGVVFNQKQDRVFYVWNDGTRSRLVSRHVSTLIYDRSIISENAVSFVLSADTEAVAFLSSRNELILRVGESEKVIDVNVTEYFFSGDGKRLIYEKQNADGHGVDLYKYESGEVRLILKGTDVIMTDGDCSSALILSDRILSRYIASTNEILPLCEKLEELIYAGDILYYTEESEDGLSLICNDGTPKVISDRLDSVVYSNDSIPFVVFSEYGDDGEIAYKTLYSTGSITELGGDNLYGFMTDGERIYYTDASKDQTMLIGAYVAEGAIHSFTVIDTDIDLLCGIISGKPIYIKNFNPISNEADLYFNSERIHSSISTEDIGNMPEYLSDVYSFDYVYRGIPGERCACVHIYNSEAVLYNADGRLYRFDGRDEIPLCISELKNAYPISEDSLAAYEGGILTVISGAKKTNVGVVISRFIPLSYNRQTIN